MQYGISIVQVKVNYLEQLGTNPRLKCNAYFSLLHKCNSQRTNKLAPSSSHAKSTTTHHGPSIAVPPWGSAVPPMSSIVVSPLNDDWAWAVGWCAIDRAAAGSSKSEAHFGLKLAFFLKQLLGRFARVLRIVRRVASRFLVSSFKRWTSGRTDEPFLQYSLGETFWCLQ